MPNVERDLSDVAILTKAIERVFRKLVRLLIGRISLTKLQEMIRVIFVQEAETKLQRESPGKNISLSSLAALSGLDTRTLSKIFLEESYNIPIHRRKTFLREITPECSVLDVWATNPSYIDANTNKPKILPISGFMASFETLVRDSITSRGLTIKSILNRLLESKSIRYTNGRKSVEMLEKRYTPFESNDQSAVLEIGLVAVGNLVDTVAHNVSSIGGQDASFYQRGCWTNRLSNSDRKKFQEAMRGFLCSVDDNAGKFMEPFEQETKSGGMVTAGIGLFYFEQELPEE